MWRSFTPQMRPKLGNALSKFTLSAHISCSAAIEPLPRIRVKRPLLDDIQRISEGKGAKNRGTGSRQVPHRLNQDERSTFDIARKNGFLVVRGAGGGYRRERKGSPLANIYRQLCDALNQPCIVVELDTSGQDIVLVDLSPLRLIDTWAVEQAALQLSSTQHSNGIAQLSSSEYSSPFTVIVPSEVLPVLEAFNTNRYESSNDGGVNTSNTSVVTVVAEDAEDEQIESSSTLDVEKTLSYDGIADPQLSEEQTELALKHLYTAPIWQQPPQLMAFRGSRPDAKALAKLFSHRLMEEAESIIAAEAEAQSIEQTAAAIELAA